MTKEEVKQALREYLPAKQALASAKSELAFVRANADGIRAVVISGMPHGSGGTSNPVDVALHKIEEAEKDLEAAVVQYAEKLQQVEQLILSAIDTYGQTIIRLRWIEGVKFDYIPSKIHMSRRAMFEHYENAVTEISEKTESLH